MKKRLRKKADKARKKEIHKLLDLVLDINGLSKRRGDLTGHLPTAFFRFSGHTAMISIEIFKDGWESNQYSDFYEHAYSDCPDRNQVHSLACKVNEYAKREGLIR